MEWKTALGSYLGTVEKPESNLHLGQVGTGPYTLVPAQVNTVLKLDVLHPSSARIPAEIW